MIPVKEQSQGVTAIHEVLTEILPRYDLKPKIKKQRATAPTIEELESVVEKLAVVCKKLQSENSQLKEITVTPKHSNDSRSKY